MVAMVNHCVEKWQPEKRSGLMVHSCPSHAKFSACTFRSSRGRKKKPDFLLPRLCKCFLDLQHQGSDRFQRSWEPQKCHHVPALFQPPIVTLALAYLCAVLSVLAVAEIILQHWNIFTGILKIQWKALLALLASGLVQGRLYRREHRSAMPFQCH